MRIGFKLNFEETPVAIIAFAEGVEHFPFHNKPLLIRLQLIWIEMKNPAHS